MNRTISLVSLVLIASCGSGPVPNLDSADPYERYLGALAAADSRDPEGMKKVEALLKDSDPLARTGAVVAIARARPQGSLVLLIGMLADSDSSVRSEAVRAVASFKDPSSVEPLAKVLAQDASVDTRRAAALALGGYADSPALRAVLLAALSDLEAGVAYNAYRSLVRVTGRTDLPRARAGAEEALKRS